MNTTGPAVSFSQTSDTPATPPPSPPGGDDLANDDIHCRSEISLADQSVHFKASTVAVIGTGYVGFHLAEAFSACYKVIAFDIQGERIRQVEKSLGKRVTCTSDTRLLSQATHFLIAVSTVLNHSRAIDTTHIRNAITIVQEHARPGSTVVIESSVAVGMTRDLLQPLMTAKSLKCGMSPERVDPGRVSPHFSHIPKLISGLDRQSTDAIYALYSRVFRSLVRVSSPEVAEMTKLYENGQRMMCIAYANEMADACQQLTSQLNENADHVNTPGVNIDAFEVARAAATKPFGYMPYSPSLGVGGHCIPINPWYLMSNSDFPLLEACTQRMEERPSRIGDRIMASLQARSVKHKRRRISISRHAGTCMEERQDCISSTTLRLLIVGLGFKRGQSNLSNSPGHALAVHLLSSYNAYVEFADPLVEQAAVPGVPRMDDKSDWNVQYLRGFDAIIVAVDQPELDMCVIEQAQSDGTHVEWFCGLGK